METKVTQAGSDNIIRAEHSLTGLSVGDGFGEKFFVNPAVVESMIEQRAIPASPWSFTDDTLMALSIVSVLRKHGHINQSSLAQSIADHYSPYRGYGPAMHGLLALIKAGIPWRAAASSLFDGQGSFGNGSAMRVAPVGAYFANDIGRVPEQAAKSAEVTHKHPEAIAGAIAVAVAAACACHASGKNIKPYGTEFLDLILPHVPESEVRQGILRARELKEDTEVHHAAALLGSGQRVSAQDTVPFTLWCASRHLDNYQEALWMTVSGLGDRDTTCAIVGGIVILSARMESVPRLWLDSREPLPQWFLSESANELNRS
jgi:ADP-ribosylglycohydrolase